MAWLCLRAHPPLLLRCLVDRCVGLVAIGAARLEKGRAPVAGETVWVCPRLWGTPHTGGSAVKQQMESSSSDVLFSSERPRSWV